MHIGIDRVGIPLAGDDAPALEIAARLVEDAGFEIQFRLRTASIDQAVRTSQLRKSSSAVSHSLASLQSCLLTLSLGKRGASLFGASGSESNLRSQPPLTLRVSYG